MLNWERELRGAMPYALFHADDAELRAAAVEAFVQPGNGDYESRGGDDGILYAKMTDAVVRDAALVARLRAGFATLDAGSRSDKIEATRIRRVLTAVDKAAPASSAK